MDFPLILLIFTIIFTSAIAIIVYLRSPQTAVSRSFLILIGAFVVWAVIRLFLYTSPDLISIIVLEGSNYFIGLFIPLSYYIFAVKFPYRSVSRSKSLYYSIVVLAFVSAVIGVLPDGLIRGASIEATGVFFDINSGWLSVYNFTFLLIFLSAFFRLVMKYSNSSGYTRRILKYVMLSTSIAFLGGLIANLLLPYVNNFSYQVYGSSFTLIFSLTVALTLLNVNMKSYEYYRSKFTTFIVISIC